MTQMLPMGANTSLASSTGDVVIVHREDAAVDVNLTAFLVGADGKVRSDNDMVFFNQPSGENDSVRYHAPKVASGQVEHRLSFNLGALPSGVEKVVVTLTEDKGAGFSSVVDLAANVQIGGSPSVMLTPPAFSTEKGIMVCEVYVRNGESKVRAVWQGFASGLAGLATAHGVEVDDTPAPADAAPAAPAPAAPAAAPAINLKKVSGQINLKKGDKPVLIEKTPLITATVSWKSGTDYDVYALVWTRDSDQVDVAAFGADGVPARMEFSGVRHTGDVTRPSGGSEQVEKIEIKLTPDIVAVVPVAYSAQSNGTGSFRRYKVSLAINNHSGTEVTISADNANNDDNIYTCVPGIITNTADGVAIEPVELYSARNSEMRPRLKMTGKGGIEVVMDAGPKNDYK